VVLGRQLGVDDAIKVRSASSSGWRWDFMRRTMFPAADETLMAG
jgi:hypothetical protein